MVLNDSSSRDPSYVDTQGVTGVNINNLKLNFSLVTNGNNGNNSVSNYNGNMTQYRLCLGNGTTQPTFTDYAIESPIDMSNLTLSNQSYQSSNCKYINTVTLTNTGDSDITFSEIVTAAYNDGCKVALTRDVISPTTIPVGALKTITVAIDFAAMATSVA